MNSSYNSSQNQNLSPLKYPSYSQTQQVVNEKEVNTNQTNLDPVKPTAKGMANLVTPKHSGISGAYQTKTHISGSRLKRKSQNDDL